MDSDNYLATGWGDSVENPNMDDVKKAILENIAMDDEHGAFWVSINGDEYVMEVRKDLKITFVFNDEISGEKYLDYWGEAEHLYERLLAGDYDAIREVLKG